MLGHTVIQPPALLTLRLNHKTLLQPAQVSLVLGRPLPLATHLPIPAKLRVHPPVRRSQALAMLLPPVLRSQALAMLGQQKLLLPALAIQGHNHMTPLLVAPVTLRVLLQLAKLLPPA
jgi:hypothetical protein